MAQTSLLLSLLDQFTERERQEARAWLDCPLHNKKPAVARLYNYLLEHYLLLGIEVETQQAFAFACPDQAYSPARWAKLQHELLACLEAYLSYQHFQSAPFAAKLNLLKAYRQRGLDRHRKTRLNRLTPLASNEGNQASSAERFWFAYNLEREAYNLRAAKNRNDKHNLPELENKLLKALMAQKFRQACETLAHLRVASMEYQIPLLNEFSELVLRLQLTDEPGIYLFFLGTQLYLGNEQEKDSYFHQLKKGLENNLDTFPQTDQRNLLILAINHCLQQSNAGRLNYLRETLDLYQLGLKRKLLYNRGQISNYSFNNIIGIALRLGEDDWAAVFLEENARRLPPANRQEVESLNRARLAFQRREYNNTLQLLQKADYRDFIHHMTARIMQLKIFYERDNYNLLSSHIRATRTLVRRRKNPGYHEHNYRNILSLADRLIRLPPQDKTARENLINLIEQTDPCTEKEWLLQKTTT